MTNVRAYNDSQLLSRVEEIGGKIPEKGKYLIIGIQSNEDEFNKFDDKFYVYDGPEFVMVSTGTTNPGKNNLLYFKKNIKGAPIWKTDQWYEDLYRRGFHSGGSKNKEGNYNKMRALRQDKKIYFYRDSNRNEKSDQIGELYFDIINVNMHGVSYVSDTIIREQIGYWSAGCQVWNNMKDYKKMMDLTWNRDKLVDYALLKEF